MKPLVTKQSLLQGAFSSGLVLYEPSKRTLVFKLLWLEFTSSKNRVGSYSFDHPSWKLNNYQGLWFKLGLITKRKVKTLRKTK